MRAQYSRADSGGRLGNEIVDRASKAVAGNLGDTADLADTYGTVRDKKGCLMEKYVDTADTQGVVVDVAELGPVLADTLVC